MGDRVSISFKNGTYESVALFHHNGGAEFATEALAYAKELKAERGDSRIMPLDRLEPDTVMVDFIRYITHDLNRVLSSLYLGKDGSDGDNSNNGHFVINLETMTLEQD